jgi:acyl-CoA thioester hydrolase
VNSQFDWPVRVYYEDTDAGGVVFYANYLKFFERARTEWLRALGIGQHELARVHGCVFVVRHVEIDYLKPAKLDDSLLLRSSITRIGGASLSFRQQAWRDGQMLAESNITVVCVGLQTLRPMPLPEPVASALAGLSLASDSDVTVTT